MKSNFLIAVLITASFIGCKDKEIEVIPNYDAEYADVKSSSVYRENPPDKLTEIYESMNRAVKPDENREITKYVIYLGESGSVDKVKIQHDNISDTDLSNIKIMEKLKFEPFIIDNKPAKVRFEIYLSPSKADESSESESVFFVAVEEMPEPVGGMAAIQAKITYPEIAKRAGIQGRVFIKAFIDENGSVIQTEVIRGIGAGCDEAAIAAIKQTKFKPGMQRGERVKVQVTVPILFKLTEGPLKEN